MRKAILFLLCALLLSGCGAPKTPPAASHAASSPAAGEEGPRAEITAEALRSEYEAQGLIVRQIVPYEGDFLVYAGSMAADGQFIWVYTDSGTHVPLLYSDHNVLSYDILYTGCIRVLEGEDNFHNGWKSFPAYYTAHAALAVDNEGRLTGSGLPIGSAMQETYFAPVNEPHTVGCLRRESIVSAAVIPSGAEVVFGPVEAALGDFFAAVSSAPRTDIACAGSTMTLTFRSTALSSGEPPVYEDSKQQAQYTQLYGFPTAFPAGELEGKSLFIESASIQEVGEDAVLTLHLTEQAQFYTVETGQLLWNESRPYLRLTFRDTAP